MIEANTDEMSKYGQELIDESSNFNSDTDSFNSTIDSVTTAWQGQDSTKYINFMRESFIVHLKELGDVLNTYGQYLQNAAQAYESLEEEFSSRSISV